MDEIVTRLEEAPEPEPPSGGAPGRPELRYHVLAQAAGGQRKRAEVWGETTTGARRTSRWQMQCDEGRAGGGEDAAPSPLAYFSAGIAF